jgi:hypothetical protein
VGLRHPGQRSHVGGGRRRNRDAGRRRGERHDLRDREVVEIDPGGDIDRMRGVQRHQLRRAIAGDGDRVRGRQQRGLGGIDRHRRLDAVLRDDRGARRQRGANPRDRQSGHDERSAVLVDERPGQPQREHAAPRLGQPDERGVDDEAGREHAAAVRVVAGPDHIAGSAGSGSPE